MEKYLLYGLLALCLGICGFVSAGESDFTVEDNTTSSGFSIKEDTGDTTIVRFRGDGNVGIATTSPTEKLEVNGNIKISGTGNGVKFADGTSQTTAATGGGGSGDGHSLDASDGAPADALFVDGSGNVGIGTTGPGAQLEVENSGGTTVIVENTDSNQASIDLVTNSSAQKMRIIQNTGSFAFFDSDDAVERLTILDNSGNVGIGTTAPTEKLDVAGNINASGAVTQGSSRAIKDNIMRISSQQAMRAFEQLEPVSFVYKDDSSMEERLGFIAEDVPDLVATQDRKHLNAMDLTAVLTKVVQEQQKMLQEQKEAITAMKQEMQMMKSATNYGVKGL